jgi:hypothetical protein
MNDRPTALERAFQLAKSGQARSKNDIRRQLVPTVMWLEFCAA